MSPLPGARPGRSITVYGATGHTGRFVVAELLARGWTPILSGRDSEGLRRLGMAFPGLDQRVAAIEDAPALDRALDGAAAVINAAGPFMDTAAPLVDAALRAGVHYLDTAAEQAATLATFERSGEARAAGVVLMPAMAFYGGFADLLATAALGDWPGADRIDVGVALDSWHPTRGTRITGERNTAPRSVVSDGRLVPQPLPPGAREWEFPAPFGAQQMLALPLSEMIVIQRHLPVREIRSWMNSEPLKDLRDPQTPAPIAADERGRSAQRFVLEVVLQRDGRRRRALAEGRDIYAVSAPLIVEAATRLVLQSTSEGGAFAPGQRFDAGDFVRALAPEHFTFQVDAG